MYSVIWSKHLILLVHHIWAKHMSFSKWNKRMVPYSITIYFVTLLFIHLNFHWWETCNLNSLAIFFFFNHYKFNFYSNHYINIIWGRCKLKRSQLTVICFPVYKISSLKITSPKTPSSGQFSYSLPNIVSFLFEKKID